MNCEGRARCAGFWKQVNESSGGERSGAGEWVYYLYYYSRCVEGEAAPGVREGTRGTGSASETRGRCNRKSACN